MKSLSFIVVNLLVFMATFVNISFAGKLDINGDNAIDLKDAVSCLKIITGNDVLSGLNLSVDIDGDNKIGIQEAVFILRVVSDPELCYFTLVSGHDMNIYEQSRIRLCGFIPDCSSGMNTLWRQLEGISVSLSNADALCRAEFVSPAAANPVTLKFRLAVTGKYGFPASDDINLTVLPVPQTCRNFILSDAALANMDLSKANYQHIHDVLQTSDPVHAYQVFIRSPDIFMNWINLGATLSSSVHEANHQIDFKMETCTYPFESKYLFMGTAYPSGLKFGDTAHYSIVEETIDPALKNSSRYEIYIEGHKDAKGNDFTVLLDELNAYVGDSWFQIQFQNSGLPKENDVYKTDQFQVDGVINFMVFLQYYLKSARLNHEDTYQAIRTNSSVLSHIQRLWSSAESILKDAYPLILSDWSSTYIFFSWDEATGLDYLKAAYSEDLLSELKRLNIYYLPESVWKDTYYSYDSTSLRGLDKWMRKNLHPQMGCKQGRVD